MEEIQGEIDKSLIRVEILKYFSINSRENRKKNH